MAKGTILIILGAIVVLAQFSGLPSAWLDVILPLTGLAVIIIGYQQRPKVSKPSVEVAAA